MYPRVYPDEGVGMLHAHSSPRVFTLVAVVQVCTRFGALLIALISKLIGGDHRWEVSRKSQQGAAQAQRIHHGRILARPAECSGEGRDPVAILSHGPGTGLRRRRPASDRLSDAAREPDGAACDAAPTVVVLE